MQNIGQTTAVQFGNALDPRGRANHPKPACARAHGNQVGTVLAKDQSVWSSRNIYTLITSRTRIPSSDVLALIDQQKAGGVDDRPVKEAEFDILASGQNVIGRDTSDSTFFAET